MPLAAFRLLPAQLDLEYETFEKCSILFKFKGSSSKNINAASDLVYDQIGMTSHPIKEIGNCQECEHWRPEVEQCLIMHSHDSAADRLKIKEASDQCILFKPKGKTELENDFPFL